jgi:dolichyl-phosphate beta-glucosyltransferase
MVRVGFGIKQRDTQCGFKLLTREAAHDLFGRQRIDGFSFDLELLFLANRQGYTVAEIPVEWIDAPSSTVDAAKVAVQFLKDLVNIRLRALRGGYRNVIHHPAEPEVTNPQTLRSAA